MATVFQIRINGGVKSNAIIWFPIGRIYLFSFSTRSAAKLWQPYRRWFQVQPWTTMPWKAEAGAWRRKQTCAQSWHLWSPRGASWRSRIQDWSKCTGKKWTGRVECSPSHSNGPCGKLFIMYSMYTKMIVLPPHTFNVQVIEYDLSIADFCILFISVDLEIIIF